MAHQTSHYPALPEVLVDPAVPVVGAAAPSGVKLRVDPATHQITHYVAGGVWVAVAVAGSCPNPMTRAALVNLRNTSALMTGCHYTVTDHVQGRLVAGTTVTLHATAVNELSELAQVNTTYDNEAWAGIYDADRGLVLELQDNRNNVARGINGTEVANFDWGNSSYTNSRVDNATLTVTIGNTRPITNLAVDTAASLNLTGFLGAINNLTVSTATTVNLSNATGTWRLSTFADGGSFNATGYTGGGDNYYNEIRSPAVTFSALTGQFVLRNVEAHGFTATLAGAAGVSITASHIRDGALINRQATGGALSITRADFGNASITHSGAGGLTINGGALESGGSVVLSGTGQINMTNARVEQSGSVSGQGAGIITLIRAGVRQIGSVLTDLGSTSAISVTDSDIESSSTARAIAPATAALSLNGGSILTGGSFVYVRNAGAYAGAHTRAHGASGVDMTGTRGLNTSRLTLNEVGRVSVSGLAPGVTDTINEVSVRTRGQINIGCTGPANAVLYSDVAGLSGLLSFLGTTGNQSWNRLTCQDGQVSVNNTAVNVGLVLSRFSSLGSLSINSVVTAKTLQYLDADSNGSITINESTGGGVITNVKVMSGGLYTVSTAASGAARVTVMGGALSHNGGALSSVVKAGSSTWTTGNFNHTNTVFMRATSLVSTAANTDRFSPPAGGLVL